MQPPGGGCERALHIHCVGQETTLILHVALVVMHVHVLPFARTEKRRKETMLVPRIVDTMFF